MAGFQEMLKLEDARGVGQVAKGDRGEGRARSGGGDLTGHLAFKSRGLNSPQTEQAPAGGGHGLDQGCLDRITGLELKVEGRGEALETSHGFALENEGVGDEAVTGSVPRRDAFAFRGERPGGFSGVGAVRN